MDCCRLATLSSRVSGVLIAAVTSELNDWVSDLNVVRSSPTEAPDEGTLLAVTCFGFGSFASWLAAVWFRSILIATPSFGPALLSALHIKKFNDFLSLFFNLRG